jgi:chromosome segregation ATPase
MDKDGLEGIDPVGEQEIRGDLRDLLNALKDNRTATATQLAALDHKIDEIPSQLEQVRRDQTSAIDQLRREFQAGQIDLRRELQAMFVPRTEYDPKHAILIDRITKIETLIERQAQQIEVLSSRLADTSLTAQAKFTEYDRLVGESRGATASWVVMQEDIKSLKTKMEKVENKGAATWTRIASITAFVVSIVAVMTQLLQHVTIHP